MFTTIFIVFLVTEVMLRQWLALRQARYVSSHSNQVPVQFSDRISLHSHKKAANYTIERIRLSSIENITEAVVLIGFTLLGGLQWLDINIARLFDGEIVRQLALIGVVFAIMGVIGLPFTVYRKFILEQKFGFNRVIPKLFITDTLTALFLILLLGTPLFAAIIWIMGNTGTNWVLLAWLTWVAFKVLVLWLFPTFIAPMFNKFTSLDKAEIRDRVESLAQRCEFPLKDLYVMDGSKRSSHGNAYFTGFGNNRRIVFFDTLLDKLEPEEVEAVLAHELGHFKHRHILKRTLFSTGMALVFLLALKWLSESPWFYTGLGVIPQLGRPNDALALILFMLSMPIFTFWLAPLLSYFSRRDEFQADEYAAKQSSSSALISALLKLYKDNAATLTPDPIYSAFNDSHPPAIQRIQALEKQ